jgi:tRNA modification GTPase
MDDLAQTLALVEAGIDFSDEDITFLDAPQVAQAARRAEQSLAGLLNESPRFERLSHEPRIVLVGRPNAGKSTLLNLLSESTRAVVSPRAGTTRDVIHADAVLDRGIVHIVDAAGLEDRVDSDADDSPRAQIARQMHQRSLAEVQRADAVVLLVECDDPRPMLDLRRDPDLVVMTKVDRSHDSLAPPNSDSGRISISAHSGAGIDLLKQRLSSLAFGQDAPGSALALKSRHREAIGQAMASLARAKDLAVSATPELLALELRDALDALGRILGQMTPDDVLGRVFATFCIGK